MWLIQSRQRDGGLAQRPTLSQYEHERVNSELSVGKFSLILRSCGSCLGNWIVTTAPCVVTASVTGSHYNCRALNPFGGNQTSASCRQIIWYSSSIGHYYSYPDDMMTLNFSMNRNIKTLHQTAPCDSCDMSLHGQQRARVPMVTSTSCVTIMSPAGPGQQIDSNWQPVVNVAVFLRIFCETGSVTRISDVERNMVVT